MLGIQAADLRVGIVGHMWTLVLSTAVAKFIPVFFGIAIVAKWSNDAQDDGNAIESLRLAVTLAEGFLLAVPPAIWLAITIWFVGSALGLRSQRVAYWFWMIWYALTIAVSYVLVVFIFYPKSDFGRHAILISEVYSIDSAIGIASSALIGAALGAALRLLTPKWPLHTETGLFRPS